MRSDSCHGYLIIVKLRFFSMRDESRKLFSYFPLAPESAEMLRPTKLRQHDQRLKQITVYLRGGWVSRILFSDQTSKDF